MIPKICLTGGPCAGKSTALSYVSQKLGDRGFYPFIVPEAPTLLMRGNYRPSANTPAHAFQRSAISMMRFLENEFDRGARESSHPKPILICDRGIPDCSAYMSKSDYQKTLVDLGLASAVRIRDERYHGVFHLRSAALGAEEFYTTENNTERRETLEEARAKDEETLRVWTGHPHLRIIDNSTDFEGKLRRLDANICRVLGIPVPLEIEKKFLCHDFDPEQMLPHFERIEIEQTYLISPIEEVEYRVRKRGQYGSFVYFKTEKRKVRPGVRVETEEIISPEVYETHLKYRDLSRRTIVKHRFCFVHKNQYFELDRMTVDGESLYLLEIELTEENDDLILPDFIPIQKDVTHDTRYSNASLAQMVA